MIQSFVIFEGEFNNKYKEKKSRRALNQASPMCPQHLLPRLLQAAMLLVRAPG